ncbi:hypothetical protein Bmayo_04680 (plasmid) [Borreliella mayonii]|uniref:Uncharacterized protein n=1 Tax=Borreliella mayonii TaxID=1674146 RepID=A0AAC9KX46_9SPIR|nr:hypothetical protein A7X70_05900 [Borreliella mayonii]APT00442.1 hypothetical protein Bmayo_04680 [Borreliella mayonii]
MYVKVIIHFLANISLFSFKKDVRLYIYKIESIHTEYCFGNFKFDFFAPDKIFKNKLQSIENNILIKYIRESV